MSVWFVAIYQREIYYLKPPGKLPLYESNVI